MAVEKKQVGHPDLVGGGQTPLHSHAVPPWYAKFVGAYGDGNPNIVMMLIQRGTIVAPTPTNITISIARCSAFCLQANLVVNKIRFYGVGATTNIYRVAIYRYSDGARLTSELVFSTTANAWGSVTVSPAVTLQAGVIYYVAVAVNATGTTAGVVAMGTTIAAATGQIQTAPQSLPGNLGFAAGLFSGYLFQFAVTSGALPATAPTLAAQAAWTGGMPAFFLDNSSA